MEEKNHYKNKSPKIVFNYSSCINMSLPFTIILFIFYFNKTLIGN